MSVEWSDLPDKVSVLPIQAKDGFVLSHTTDGGVTYSASKFGLVEELQAYLQADTGPLFTGDTTLVVAIGTSGTGIKGRWDAPYPTVLLAQSAAVAGDTIIVFGNVVGEEIIGKNGVDYIFNGNIDYAGSNAIFDDDADTVISNITVHGDITLTGQGYVAFTSDSDTVFKIKCHSIKQANSSTKAFIECVGGGVVEFEGNIESNSSNRTVNVATGSRFRMRGDMTNEGTGVCIKSNSGDIDFKGNIHCELGKAILLVGNTEGYFDGNFSSNSQTAADYVIRIESNTSGAIEIKGNITLTNANSTAGALTGIGVTAPVNVYANITSDIAKVVSVTQTSTGFKLHGKITALGNTAASHPINLEDNGVNTMTLASSCVLVATHASAFGVSNDGNAVNQSVTNYGAVTNRVVDPDLAAAKVKALIHDSNVI